MREKLYTSSVGAWKRYRKQLEGINKRLQPLIAPYEQSMQKQRDKGGTKEELKWSVIDKGGQKPPVGVSGTSWLFSIKSHASQPKSVWRTPKIKIKNYLCSAAPTSSNCLIANGSLHPIILCWWLLLLLFLALRSTAYLVAQQNFSLRNTEEPLE